MLTKNNLFRIALPYLTTDPIPGTKDRAIKEAIRILGQPLQGLSFLIKGITVNGDADYTPGSDFVSVVKSLKEKAPNISKKLQEIITLQTEPRNDYELIKQLRWEVNMLGYLYDDVKTFIYYLDELKNIWNQFFSSMFGITNVNTLDNIYKEAGEDLEEYFGTISIWDYLQKAFKEIENLYKAVDAIKAYKLYQEAQLNYALKWQKEYGVGGSEKVFPEGLEDLEIMWHVTTACDKVLKEGLKAKKNLPNPAGLGGGSSDLISFTASYAHAEAIRDSILDMIELAKHPLTFKKLIEYFMGLGLSKSKLEEALDNWPYKKPELEQQLTFDEARNWYEFLSMYAQNEGVKYSALFWAPDQKIFAKLDPNQVCIVEAVVDTTDPRTTYHRAEEEWRIPPERILSLGPVGSQVIA